MGATNNKALLITTNSAISNANEWMDNCTQEMIKLEESTEKWKELLCYEESSEYIDKPFTSDVHSAYANY